MLRIIGVVIGIWKNIMQINYNNSMIPTLECALLLPSLLDFVNFMCEESYNVYWFEYNTKMLDAFLMFNKKSLANLMLYIEPLWVPSEEEVVVFINFKVSVTVEAHGVGGDIVHVWVAIQTAISKKRVPSANVTSTL